MKDRVCGICFDPIPLFSFTGVNLVLCEHCGNATHMRCAKQWLSTCQTGSLKLSCPSCRGVLCRKISLGKTQGSSCLVWANGQSKVSLQLDNNGVVVGGNYLNIEGTTIGKVLPITDQKISDLLSNRELFVQYLRRDPTYTRNTKRK